MLLRVLLFLLCATGTAAQSAVCAAVGDTCSVKLKALDTATATANAFTFCPFLKTIYHDTTEGCMGAPEAQCCCCEKETFVDPLNKVMKETKELGQLWPFNPSCKDAPLQCDPSIDCNACPVAGAKCSTLTECADGRELDTANPAFTCKGDPCQKEVDTDHCCKADPCSTTPDKIGCDQVGDTARRAEANKGIQNAHVHYLMGYPPDGHYGGEILGAAVHFGQSFKGTCETVPDGISVKVFMDPECKAEREDMLVASGACTLWGDSHVLTHALKVEPDSGANTQGGFKMTVGADCNLASPQDQIIPSDTCTKLTHERIAGSGGRRLGAPLPKFVKIKAAPANTKRIMFEFFDDSFTCNVTGGKRMGHYPFRAGYLLAPLSGAA